MNARQLSTLTMFAFITLHAVAAHGQSPAEKLVGRWRVDAKQSAKLNMNQSLAVLFELASFNYEVEMRKDGQYAAVISGVGNGKKESGKWSAATDSNGKTNMEIVKDGNRGTQQVVIKFVNDNVMTISAEESTVFVMNRVVDER